VVAADFGRVPHRRVVRPAGRRVQGRPLLGLEMLQGPPLGPRVPPLAVVLEAPLAPPRASGVEIDQRFAREAIVPDAGDGPFDPSLLQS
jgi:hypothetical protein